MNVTSAHLVAGATFVLIYEKLVNVKLPHKYDGVKLRRLTFDPLIK